MVYVRAVKIKWLLDGLVDWLLAVRTPICLYVRVFIENECHTQRSVVHGVGIAEPKLFFLLFSGVQQFVHAQSVVADGTWRAPLCGMPYSAPTTNQFYVRPDILTFVHPKILFLRKFLYTIFTLEIFLACE